MTTELKYTERDLILAKQDAFTKGAAWRFDRACEDRSPFVALDNAPDAYRDTAKIYYPLKVKRPRVVTLPGGDYRVIDGVLETNVGGNWRRAGWTVKEISTLAKLIAEPLEEVEDDGNV